MLSGMVEDQRNTSACGRAETASRNRCPPCTAQAFDELLLLKPGGKTIFCGPLGPEQQNLIGHFESVDGVEGFTIGNNPANWMLDVTAPGAESALGVDFAQIYKDSPLAARAREQVRALLLCGTCFYVLHFCILHFCVLHKRISSWLLANSTFDWS